MSTTKCPQCHGEGKMLAAFLPVAIHCDLCEGTGEMTEEKARWREIGRAHRDRRIAQRMSLRDYARQHEISVVALSKMERGAIDSTSLAALNLPATTTP